MQGEEKLNDVELEKESRLWRCEGDDGVGVKVKIIMQQARAFHHFAPRISCKFSLVCIWGLIGSRETFGGKARPAGPISRLPTYTAPTLLYTSSVDRQNFYC
jgi:hypothetical protein